MMTQTIKMFPSGITKVSPWVHGDLMHTSNLKCSQCHYQQQAGRRFQQRPPAENCLKGTNTLGSHGIQGARRPTRQLQPFLAAKERPLSFRTNGEKRKCFLSDNKNSMIEWCHNHFSSKDSNNTMNVKTTPLSQWTKYQIHEVSMFADFVGMNQVNTYHTK